MLLTDFAVGNNTLFDKIHKSQPPEKLYKFYSNLLINCNIKSHEKQGNYLGILSHLYNFPKYIYVIYYTYFCKNKLFR